MDAVDDQAPGTVLLVRDFINTVEWQTDEESLATPADLGRWLRGHGMNPAGAPVGDSELELARTIREGLRAVLASHAGHDVGLSAILKLNRALATVPLVLEFTGSGDHHLVPAKPAKAANAAKNAAALAHLVAAINASQREGTWERLKVCARDSCRWAFYDASRNRSGRWCSMAGCGNHIKMQRAYAARKRRPVPGSTAR